MTGQNIVLGGQTCNYHICRWGVVNIGFPEQMSDVLVRSMLRKLEPPLKEVVHYVLDMLCWLYFSETHLKVRHHFAVNWCVFS